MENINVSQNPEELILLGNQYKAVNKSGSTYRLVLKIKDTNEFAIYKGSNDYTESHEYALRDQIKIIVELLSSDFYSTGIIKLVSPTDLEILDPQPDDYLKFASS